MSEAAQVGIAKTSERVAPRVERPQLQLVRKVEVRTRAEGDEAPEDDDPDKDSDHEGDQHDGKE